MAMPHSATRIRYLTPSSGSHRLYGTTYPVTRGNGQEKIISSYDSRDSDNAFFLDRWTIKGGLINGSRRTPPDVPYVAWDNLPCTFSTYGFTGPSAYKFSEADAALRAFNITNPSRHSQSILSSIVELKDLPKMVRLAGRVITNPNFRRELVRESLSGTRVHPQLEKAGLGLSAQNGLSAAKSVAAANLAWQFGWAPIISDINKLCNFQAAVAKRRNEINRLHSGRGLHRRVTIEDSSLTEKRYVTVYSNASSFIDVQLTSNSVTKRWATTRWKPMHGSVLPPTDFEIQATLLGLDAHGMLASGWELLPWSWLIDWFTNVGDIIQSSSNQMQAVCTTNLMSTKSQTITSPETVMVWFNGLATVSAHTTVIESKTRWPGFAPGNVGLSANIPILGTNQLSILSSLFVLRGGR